MKNDKKKLSQIIIKDIITKIQDGQYSRQSRLPSEMELARTYNVGRSTVREALGVLKSYGVISSLKGGGHFLEDTDLTFLMTTFELDTEEYMRIKYLLELRYTLEPEAAYLAAERKTEEDLTELQKALDSIKSTLSSPDSPGQEEDFQFHKALIQATHNPFMIKVLDDLSEWYQRALSLTLKQNIGLIGKRQSVYKEHEDIFNAIKEGKPNLAKVLTTMHLDSVQKKLNYLFWMKE